MLRRVGSQELNEWRAYLRVEPSAAERIDLLGARLLAAWASKPTSPAEFVIDYDKAARERLAAKQGARAPGGPRQFSYGEPPRRRPPQQSWQQQLAMMKALFPQGAPP
jgi:hypothetical protein